MFCILVYNLLIKRGDKGQQLKSKPGLKRCNIYDQTDIQKDIDTIKDKKKAFRKTEQIQCTLCTVSQTSQIFMKFVLFI